MSSPDQNREVPAWMSSEDLSRVLQILKEGGSYQVTGPKIRWRIIEVPPAMEAWKAVCFIAHSGARLPEVEALRWSDVKLKEKTVHLGEKANRKTEARSGGRTIPMCDALVSFLASLPRGEPEQQVFTVTSGINRAYRKALRCAGLSNFSLQSLRDTLAAHLVRQGADLVEVGLFLGIRSSSGIRKFEHLAQIDTEVAVKRLKLT